MQFGQNYNRTTPQFCGHMCSAVLFGVVYKYKKKKKNILKFWTFDFVRVREWDGVFNQNEIFLTMFGFGKNGV